MSRISQRSGGLVGTLLPFLLRLLTGQVFDGVRGILSPWRASPSDVCPVFRLSAYSMGILSVARVAWADGMVFPSAALMEKRACSVASLSRDPGLSLWMAEGCLGSPMWELVRQVSSLLRRSLLLTGQVFDGSPELGGSSLSSSGRMSRSAASRPEKTGSGRSEALLGIGGFLCPPLHLYIKGGSLNCHRIFSGREMAQSRNMVENRRSTYCVWPIVVDTHV